jgi:hypothetical protein
LGFLLCCIGEGVSGWEIDRFELGTEKSSGGKHIWLFWKGINNRIWEHVGKAIESLGVFIFLSFIFIFVFLLLLPHTHLQTSFLVYCLFGTSSRESHICISRCHSVAFFVLFYQTNPFHLHFLRATLEYEAGMNATSLFLLSIMMKISREEILATQSQI